MTPSGLVCLAADKPGGWSLPARFDRSDAPDQRHVRSYLQRHVTPYSDRASLSARSRAESPGRGRLSQSRSSHRAIGGTFRLPATVSLLGKRAGATVSTPPDADPPRPLTFEELADLQAGLLNAQQEEELRERMLKDPGRAARMLGALAEVDRAFPGHGAPGEQDVPPQVAARWQMAIAEEAERRARGYPVAPDEDAGTGGH